MTLTKVINGLSKEELSSILSASKNYVEVLKNISFKYKVEYKKHSEKTLKRVIKKYELVFNATRAYTQLEALKILRECNKNKHNSHYSFENVVYKSNKSKIDITCPIHGDFKSSLHSFVKGEGCKKCAIEKQSQRQRLSNEYAFARIKEANELHFNNKYTFENFRYERYEKPVEITCPEHGKFYKRFDKFINGSGCQSCSKYCFNINKPAILYYLRVDKDGDTAYKIGITNKSVKERYSAEEMKSITVLAEWSYAFGKDCLAKEQEILNDFKYYKWDGKKLLRNGNSELFYSDILGLDQKSA